MKEDYEFVHRVVSNKNNEREHYPSCKKLIKLFLYKWRSKEDTRLYKLYSRSLQTALKMSIS